MSTVGFATLDVIPSVKGLRSELEKQTSGDLAAAGKRGGKRFGDAAGTEASSGFKSKFANGLRGFNPLAGLAVGAGAVALFKGAIAEASDLGEAGSKINVIFGDAAATVSAFADAASESIGQSDLQARNAAATFGVFGKSAGLAGEELAGFSTEMTKLASDLASFHNTDVQTAIEAIGSGLRGEAEPLRAFGVLLDDATLRTEALAQGLVKTTKSALTPQQKVLAAHAVIMRQTADAQGDFERTSDGLANSSRDLAADWADMRAALGEELLPAAQAFVGFTKDEMLPALSTAGGLAKDATVAFASLPAPVLAGAAAFTALRIAAATSLGTAVAGGTAAVASAMTGLRIRTMLATDAFHQARAASITLTGPLAGVSMGASRAAASMAALRASATGAGAAMASGLGRVSALVGGPWGAAFIAGTAILTKFYAQNQKVKAQIESMKGTFDQQTGEFTAETAKQALGAIGDEWLQYAKEIGISMTDLTAAAVEGGPALDAFLEKYGDILKEENSIETFTSQIEDANKVVKLSQNAFEATKEGVDGYIAGLSNSGAAAKSAASANDGLAASFESYRTQIRNARTDLQKLIEKEEERAANAIQNRRDQLGLITTFQAAREEADKGRRTLDEHTKAGQANMAALLDLADQWSTSTPKVQNASGAYEDMRRKFILVAQEMGATKGEARDLASELLKVPKTAPVRFQSEGYQQTVREIRELRREAQALAQVQTFRFDAHADQLDRRPALASGGLLRGPGTGTSDSILMWGSDGEFMQRKAAVDYYGVDFMRRLNALQVPKLPGYAQGGAIQAPASRPSAGGGNHFHGPITIQANTYEEIMRKIDAKTRLAQSDRVRSGGAR